MLKYDNNKNKFLNQKFKARSNKNFNAQKQKNSFKNTQKENTSLKQKTTKRIIHYRKKNPSKNIVEKNNEKKITSCNSLNLKNIVFKDLKSNNIIVRIKKISIDILVIEFLQCLFIYLFKLI